ncbi:MAG: c-type cytochrome [SAR324 cluster bacterium]|nr:c-type cytochrome [SAR324 cluster bacterium]
MKIFNGLMVFITLSLIGCQKDVAPNIQVNSDPEILARGQYLVHHVASCIDCHSERNWDYFSGPLVEGTEGKGGEVFPEEAGFPGNLYADNITPAGLKGWTDGEIHRAVTEGRSQDGHALFPLMPYLSYGQMATEDAHAIVAYLKTLRPIENNVPETDLNFPLNLIVRTMPMKANPQPLPERSNEVEYGRYLVTIAACADCHTQADKGEKLPGMDYAGGFEFKLPRGGTTYSANITSDNDTGIGLWTKEQFIDKFKSYDTPEAKMIPVQAGEKNTVMPWTMFAGMTREDLGAIYEYLRTIPVVSNTVTIFVPAN